MVKVLLKNNKNDQFRFMLNEAAKVQRTIDPKLWASVQSACSRKYKDTLGEDAVPPVKDDKDTLLARYVAGLIILKQPCPESLSDIDKIGAFKQFGHKLINVFGCSLYDIQVLYNENRGNLPAVKVDNELSQSFDNDANITRSEEEIERIKKEQDDLDKELAAKDMSNTKEIKDLDKHVQASKEKEFDNTRYSETDLAAAKNRVVQNQARSRNSMPNTDVSRIDKVEMNIDGKKQTIYPHRIAMLTESYLNDMLNNPDTKVFKKYFDKPIIWTFEIETAATDGIRIFFNPGFADKLFSMDGEVMQRKKQLGHDTSGILGHSIQFVVIHEAYHQIYQHFIREQMKPETSGKPELHGLANIAQDVEINRDIENQIPMFYGMTKTIGGCFDTRFPTEAWELIFDAYYNGAAQPPQAGGGQTSGKYNPQQGQLGGQGQQGQLSGQQSGQGQSGLGSQQSGQLQGQLAGQQSGQQSGQGQSEQGSQQGTGSGLGSQLQGQLTGQEGAGLNGQQGNGVGQEANGQGQSGQEQGQGSQSEQNGNGQGAGNDDNGDDPNAVIDGSNIETPAIKTGIFGGYDVLSHEDAQAIAERAGQPYDIEDIKANPIKKCRDFIDKHRQELNQVGAKNAGKGSSLMDRLNQIEELFKPVIDWKKQLRHFFNSVSREGKEYKFLKNRVATRNPVVRPSRYAKYDERKFEIEDGITQIFFLIDNSGSMYGQARSNGNSDIFNMLWSEIIGLLKSTSVKHCALTYFSDGPIDPNNVRTWDERTSKTQIMKMVKLAKDLTGGTNIVGSCEAVYELGRPYYSRTEPATLLICMTDGIDDLKPAANIPFKVRKNMIWLIVNDDKNHLDNIMQTLIKCGFRERNIILVDTSKLDV